MTGFEKRLAELEARMEQEELRTLAHRFFVNKFLKNVLLQADFNDDFVNHGFQNKAELARILNTGNQEHLHGLIKQVDTIVSEYKRSSK